MDGPRFNGAVGTLDEVLEHHGIKGMRWGVRRGVGTPSAHPSSDDAHTTDASKAKVKSGGTHALSTKELQELVTRMNLEKQYKLLAPPSKGKQAGKFIADTLLTIGKQQATKYATDLAAKQIAGLLKK